MLRFWIHCWLLGCVLGLGFTTQAHAQDRRVALLVVNQSGWKKDPYLRYALQGDLQPLAHELRRLGFQVKTLVNQSPDSLRRQMKKLQQRFLQKPQVDTFLFYYSGHADRKQLHMGNQTKNDFTYQEFLSTFKSFQVKRKFAIFDACFSGEIIRLFGSQKRYRHLLQSGRLKGVGYRIPINISRLKSPNQGQEQGFRIITSSLEMSWELNQYKASVFTYHLLQGLKGPADLDRDGKISVDELFDFTSRAVKRVTGQKPQQLVVMRRARPYALAPAYRSRLTIGANVVGTLYVAVANFVWSHRKSKRRPLTLSVVDGKGVVQWKHRKQCYQQNVILPKGGELQLSKKWSAYPCRRVSSLRSKGLILPARVEPPRSRASTERSISLSLGVTQQGYDTLRDIQPNVNLDFRWRWFQTGLGFTHGFLPGKTFSLSRVTVQAAAGWPLVFERIHSRWFVGAFAQGGLVFQHLPGGNGSINLTAAFGGLTSFTWWHRQWGLRLNAALGGDYTPTSGGSGLSLFWHVATAFVWKL